ncbi:MAG: hypothetical protein Q9M31_07525 [Mariprofundus sp.]|nr:hypothetical protein [Mariprofundus sp.]
MLLQSLLSRGDFSRAAASTLAVLKRGCRNSSYLRDADIYLFITEPIAKLWVDERQSHFESIFEVE